jgi:hypothetical protein
LELVGVSFAGYVAPMTAAKVIEEIKHWGPNEQAEVILFLCALGALGGMKCQAVSIRV